MGRQIARPCHSAPKLGLSSRRAAIAVLEDTSKPFSTGAGTVAVGPVAAFLEQWPREATPPQCATAVADPRSVPEAGGKVVPFLILDGLHHDYRSAA